MVNNLIQKSLNILLKRQTNILSAAFVIMGTTVLSMILGIVRQRLLISLFGASSVNGVYLASGRLPDLLFQIVIAAALYTAFIPVFSDYLARGEEKEAHKMASNLLTLGVAIFALLSLVLWIFAPFFAQLLNPGDGFTPEQIHLMVDLMRLTIIGQFLFIIATFFTALLQSYNHFFIPGFAATMYNLGIIICLLLFSSTIGIYAAGVGIIAGAFLFILVQIPLVKKTGFSYKPSFSFNNPAVHKIGKLMLPRSISLAIFQFGTLATLGFVSFLPDAGRNYVIFDMAQMLAFAPVSLIGNAIAQAALPVLSREKNKLEEFKVTFLSSFNQMLYLVLPISALLLVLRIPIVRIVFGASRLDWEATKLTGLTLAFLSFSIFSQALITLIYRAFYALHNTKIPLFVGAIGTVVMVGCAYMFVIPMDMGIQGLAKAYSLGSIFQLVLLLFLLDRKVGGFDKWSESYSLLKLFTAAFFTAFALYIPIKLLDQLVFDTTKTINLLILTGISSFAGLSLYLFLTWFFNVREASTYILMIKKVGDWREILGESEEPLENPKL